MKPSVVVGPALAALILIACLVVPMLPSPRKTTLKAQEQALAAQRMLARVSLTAQRLDGLADTRQMTAGDLDAAVAAAEADLGKMRQRVVQQLQADRSFLEARGLPVPEIQPPGAGVGGVRQALSGFQGDIKADSALLVQAVQEAQAARSTDATALGAAQALGMAEYVRAAMLLLEAEALRVRQLGQQVDLLDAAAGWKQARGQLDYYRGLDVAPLLPKLRADLEELAGLRAEAAQHVQELRQQVTEREQALAQAEAAMGAAREERLTLERTGFVAGDDRAFEAYRTKYLELSRKLQVLEEQEQQLHHGGRTGARLIGTDATTAVVEGGERVAGLDELRRQLATAEERSARFTDAHLILEEHIGHLTAAGEQAKADAARLEARVGGLEAEKQKLAAAVLEAAKLAQDKEDEALRSASTAVQAFGQAQSAAQTWLQNARQTQSERDPQRKNPRLRALLADNYLEQVARSAGAATQVLIGRIHDQRLAGTQSLIHDLQALAEFDPGFSFDAAPFTTIADGSRQGGVAALGSACGTYDQIVTKLRGQPTEWVPLAALAGAQYVTWHVDPTLPGPSGAGTYRDSARNTIEQVVARREQFPYARAFVQFLQHLGGAAPAEAAPSEPGAEEPSGDKDDFFK